MSLAHDLNSSVTSTQSPTSADNGGDSLSLHISQWIATICAVISVLVAVYACVKCKSCKRRLAPRVMSHPRGLKDRVPGEDVSFTVQATGIRPLNYQWEWKPAESEEWQPCDAEWYDGAMLTVPSVQKSNEGWYRCVVSNCAGEDTSNQAELTVAELPGITTHPRELKDAVPGERVMFTIQATGTHPLTYMWQWKPVESVEWQPCRAGWSDGATLTIPIVQKSNEGSYCCVVSNCAGSQTSNPALLKVQKTSMVNQLVAGTLRVAAAANPYRILSLRDVLYELREVTVKWYKLGLFLGVEESHLFFIRHETAIVNERMREMVRYWLQANPEASWQTLIAALQKIDHYSIAERIKQKYCK